MKKHLTKVLSLIMVFCLVLSVVPVTASAATIKLNKTKATLSVGKKLKLKVKGTKKKATWSTSDKAVATVNAKGKVKAKKVGTATITAKVDGKTLNCAVTVEAKKAADTASKNLVTNVESIAERGDVSISIMNNNEYPVDLVAKVEFYQNGTLMNTKELTVSGLEPGKAWYGTYYNVLNNSFKQTHEAKVVVELASKSMYDASKLHASEIDVSQYTTGIKGTVTAVNNSGKDIKEAVIAFVSYDNENKIIKVERKVINDFKAGTSQTVETSASISPISKVFVLYAHE